MIVQTCKPVAPSTQWCAVLLCRDPRNEKRLIEDSSGIAGWGKNEDEAVGNLMRKWAGADDASEATDKIDIRIVC
jgi:hypothetical protein